MSPTTTTQTTTPPSELIAIPPVQDFPQSLTEDTPNTIPQQPHLPVHDQTLTASTSASRPSILERLPKKERELLEGVIDRFKALDFSFDVKLFKRARDAGNTSNVDHPTASISTNETSVHGSTSVPPTIHIQSPTTELDVTPPSIPAPKLAAARALPEDPDADDPTSPTYLAHKIQTLLQSLPPPHNDSDPQEQPFPVPSPLFSAVTTPPNSPLFSTAPTPPSSPFSTRGQTRPTPRSKLRPQPQPQPPPGTTPIADAELIEMLSSATIMNGSSSRGKRTSVWSVLEDLRAPRRWPRRTRSRKVSTSDAMGNANPTPGEHDKQVVDEGDDDGDAFSDESSIMMYSPLMPTTSSLVELAETEFMPMAIPVGDEDPSSSSGGGGNGGEVVQGGGDGGEQEEEEDASVQDPTHPQAQSPELTTEPSTSSLASAQQDSEPGSSWMKVWPFITWSTKVDEGIERRQRGTTTEAVPKPEKKDKQTMTELNLYDPPVAGPSSNPDSRIISSYAPPASADPPPCENRPLPVPTPAPAPAPLISPENPTTRRRPTFRVHGQRRWVPSTTKLSFETLWWGYRIYLPPPVLSVLSDRQLEATKRAALITTALTWFFTNIPMNAIPPAIRPAITLLKTLVPCVGYIGTFISWSWGTMMGYDEGCGIILTATWILPVALIPGTWNERDFPPASPGPQEQPTLPFDLTAAGSSTGVTNPPGAGSDSGSALPLPPASSSSTVIVDSDSSMTPVPVSVPTPHSPPSPQTLYPPHPELHPDPPPTPPPTQSSQSSPLPPYNFPYPSPTSPKSQSSQQQQLPFETPPAPTPRTIPLPEPESEPEPEPHSPMLDPSRFRPLPDLPQDIDMGRVRGLEELLGSPLPPPAPSPATIPLPDVADYAVGEGEGAVNGKVKVDRKERERERKFWKLSPKRGTGVGSVNVNSKGVSRS